jgi:hypothetical protein
VAFALRRLQQRSSQCELIVEVDLVLGEALRDQISPRSCHKWITVTLIERAYVPLNGTEFLDCP